MTDPAVSARARGQLYRFLAAAFLRPPTQALVTPLVDERVLEELERSFGTGAVQDLRTFRAASPNPLEALDQEFQELFVVPLGRYVTPYEAVYRDERVVGDEVVRGLLVGLSTLAIQQLYREAGIEVEDALAELPDHVGLELGCVGWLCAAEARACEAGDTEGVERARELEWRILDEHVMRWVPALCARVRERARGPFYRGIAALTEAFLRHESAAGTLT